MQGLEVPRPTNFTKFDTSRAQGSKNTVAYKILDINTQILTIPEYGIFRQSLTNEIDSLEHRHIGLNRQIAPQFMARLQNQYDKFAREVECMDYEPLTHSELIRDKRGPLKKRYMNAYRNLQNGVKVRADVQAFIKNERFTQEKLETKPPRMIQFRSYEYLYLLNKYLKPIDKFLMHSENEIDNQKLWTMFGKGKSSSQIAQQMHDLWTSFNYPVALCVDQSHYDGHYNEQMHQAEHDVYLKQAKVKQIKNLLEKQRKPCRGTTQFGVRYNIKGERCSGEYNTSLGNSLTNCCEIKQVMEDCGISNYKFLVNGDDSVIFIEQQDLDLFDHKHFSNYGMDAKLDKVAYTFEHIEFCQASPVNVSGKWNLIRDPSKVIGKCALMLTDYSRSVNRYVSSISLCELALSRGVPILQHFALALMTLGKCSRPLDRLRFHRATYEPTLTIDPIDYQTRISFEEAFDISVKDQIQLENDFGQSINIEKLKPFINKYKKYHQTSFI